MAHQPTTPAPTPQELVEHFEDDLLGVVYQTLLAGGGGISTPLEDYPKDSGVGTLSTVEEALETLVGGLERMPPPLAAWVCKRVFEALTTEDDFWYTLDGVGVRRQVTQGISDISTAGNRWHRWRWG